MSRATKLDLEDLLEIAAAKKWTAPQLQAAAEARDKKNLEDEAAASSGNGGQSSTGPACSGEVQHGSGGHREAEEEDQRAD